jgi:hypothetical protein
MKIHDVQGHGEAEATKWFQANAAKYGARVLVLYVIPEGEGHSDPGLLSAGHTNTLRQAEVMYNRRHGVNNCFLGYAIYENTEGGWVLLKKREF